jgi:hypothetical protein
MAQIDKLLKKRNISSGDKKKLEKLKKFLFTTKKYFN